MINQKGFIALLLFPIAILSFLAAIFTIVYLFVASPFRVTGRAMEPTLMNRQYIVAQKFGLNDLKRFDIVLYDLAENPYVTSIRRIIGLPGEEIMIRDGNVYINNQKLEEAYLSSVTYANVFITEGEALTIPSDSYFVMGDNRDLSEDSRAQGYVKKQEVIGKYWFNYGSPPKPEVSVSGPVEESVPQTNYPSATPTFKISNVSPAKGKIAFVSNGEIWLVDSDGKNSQQITNDEYNKFGLNVSSDKSKIVYSFYPKDEKKRTNQGYYVGFNSGISYVDLNTKQIINLIPYGSIQNHYPSWSSDGRYVSVWVGNGLGVKVFDIQSREAVLDLKGSNENAISAIVWVPKTNKISFIENKDIIVSNVDGSDRQTIVSGADPLRIVHEGPNLPQPPFWSSSGRYFTYYKEKKLYLFDTNNKSDIQIGGVSEDGLLGGYYSEAFPLSFSDDDSKLFYLDYSKDKNNMIVLNINTGEKKQIADFGQSAVISPDKKSILGKISEEGGTKTIVLNTDDYSQKSCSGNFQYSYYSWAGGIGYSFNQNTWSPDKRGVLGHQDHGRLGLNILNISDCTVFSLVNQEVLYGDSVWITQ